MIRSFRLHWLRLARVRARPEYCLGFATLALLTGCAHLGPKSVAFDRFDYSTAIADSWKEQTLLNIVKLRYLDLPVFVDVGSIVAGYSLETGLSAGATLPQNTAIGGRTLALGGSSVFTERPTISYVPLTGEKFLRGFITPIDPKNIFFMVQSGYPADFILALTVEGLNGVSNLSLSARAVHDADPAFGRVLQLLREVQTSGAIELREEAGKDKGSTVVLYFRSADLPADIVDKTAEIRRLLKLPPDQQKFVLTYSTGRGAKEELAVYSRSMLQIMTVLSCYVDLPEAHLAAGRALPAFEHVTPEERPGRMRIHSGTARPADAFTTVHYRGYWFWVDDGDLRTKDALTAIMYLFTFADTGSNAPLPLITIPAQ